MTVGSGAGCADPGQVCAVGLTCPPGADPVCTPRRGLAESCDAANPCLEPLRCVGTCQSRLSSGSPCVSDADCPPSAPYCDPYAGHPCDAGLLFAPGAPSCAALAG